MKSYGRFYKGLGLSGGLICLLMIFMFAGCAAPPKAFNPNITGPQMIVKPDTIRTGVARIMGTEIIFNGKGFQPGDSVFVKLLRVKKKEKVEDVPIADGNVDKKGYFTAKVGTIAKVSEILRAELGSGKKMETIIIVTQPPMPAGVYTARAVSMDTDKKAECELVVKGPSLMDRFKDWLGRLFGKIEKK